MTGCYARKNWTDVDDEECYEDDPTMWSSEEHGWGNSGRKDGEAWSGGWNLFVTLGGRLAWMTNRDSCCHGQLRLRLK